jgi:hypothetical protein
MLRLALHTFHIFHQRIRTTIASPSVRDTMCRLWQRWTQRVLALAVVSTTRQQTVRTGIPLFPIYSTQLRQMVS